MEFVKSWDEVDAAPQLPGANAYSCRREGEMVRDAPKIIPQLSAELGDVHPAPADDTSFQLFEFQDSRRGDRRRKRMRKKVYL